MRIGVISDTHGMVDKALTIMPKMGDISYIIHLGDYLEDCKYLRRHLDKKIISIKGNCDRDPKEKDEKVLNLSSQKLLAVHGHQYGVKMGLTRLYYRTLELGCNVALFGHTHVPTITKYEDVIIMNPGSIGYPRGGSKASFGIIEIDRGKVNCEIINV